ncbi:hypothetical protein CEXT_194911 [Caerostris extrusa]|uniref:Uncharacterized protein n=1 Tax=Caerostris extrusa TaxID=172846 RepID=A0AAV4MAZ9_CAEEX|nr:hypothetical protein CEXT_194911 [Caerostris extrusa]
MLLQLSFDAALKECQCANWPSTVKKMRPGQVFPVCKEGRTFTLKKGRLARKRNRLFVNSHFNRTVALIDGTSSRKNTKWGPNQGLQGGQQPLVQIAL